MREVKIDAALKVSADSNTYCFQYILYDFLDKIINVKDVLRPYEANEFPYNKNHQSRNDEKFFHNKTENTVKIWSTNVDSYA